VSPNKKGSGGGTFSNHSKLTPKEMIKVEEILKESQDM